MNKATSKNKKFQILKAAAVIVAIAVWAAVPFFSSSAQNSSIPIVTRTAMLTSPTGSSTPFGSAAWKLYSDGSRELEVQIEDVNLAAGTTLDGVIDGSVAGQLIVDSMGKGRLKLRTADGQTVPATNDGSTVEVKNGATTDRISDSEPDSISDGFTDSDSVTVTNLDAECRRPVCRFDGRHDQRGIAGWFCAI
jgi:hypothetical protein